ncbi:DNA ligase-1 [Algoriphagus ratkowskyi]|uniref:DNA ligase (ATP) n=1 Tax=Algoriphagus ratkowskyi TaxID=57028 RepID=A0A2W7R5C3_9BACT|nr:ATP-dependent DNA ligase [Algoriphagus ratkowskyi]PZX55361.1 DNA ligase-1 [Algoriphagus ratkowskyi]TXD79708.1 ATP-dependent DNA ligase [Algoriphagus ratkowskyi]
MKAFTALFTAIDQTTKTNQKVQAMVDYFTHAEEEDKIFAVSILIGNKPKRPVKTSELKEWAAELAELPMWLYEESYHIVGDLAEAIALMLPDPDKEQHVSLRENLEFLSELTDLPLEVKKARIIEYWMSAEVQERFVFNKLITGNFRMGVSKQLVIKALAKYLEQEQTSIAHQLMGKWDPYAETMDSMFAGETHLDKNYLPYPFFLAYPLDTDPATLGDIDNWYIERKLDGIRGQIIVRNEELFVWSRGEELLTDKFPEFNSLQTSLPNGTVLDGEIIPWRDGSPLPFQIMQTRIGRKNISPKYLKEAPLVMVCFDILEYNGVDLRARPLSERREILNEVIAKHTENKLLLSEAMDFKAWEEVGKFRRNARDFNCEGLMLKRKTSEYETGRRRGNWWKWKTEPMTVDGVLLYAQSGHGRRANLFTDYTFAVWDGDVLVPFAKAYSGLTDKEINVLDNWIKRNTIDKFGPVRSVKPEYVFEIAFEGINSSPRHKSGVALRFPRILRWRKDKSVKDANTKNDLLQLLEAVNS